jgi:hypothetical protein
LGEGWRREEYKQPERKEAYRRGDIVEREREAERESTICDDSLARSLVICLRFCN